jgi:hypothetical protein
VVGDECHFGLDYYWAEDNELKATRRFESGEWLNLAPSAVKAWRFKVLRASTCQGGESVRPILRRETGDNKV